MRVGIFIIGFAMGGPSRVTHSDVTIKILALQEFFKVRNLAFLFIDIKSLVEKSDPGAVVSAILKSLKAFNDYVVGLAVANVSNNTAHKFTPWLRVLCSRFSA